MDSDTGYQERLSSPRTTAIFLALTLLFGLIFAWWVNIDAWSPWTVVWLGFSLLFLFYTLNFRTLLIQISSQALKLRFGIFTWTERLDNLASCSLDQLPWLLQYGGAGIHFMTAHGRYRASFNFLEYPRVVLSLKRKRGLVRDLSFSTLHPETVLRLIQG